MGNPILDIQYIENPIYWTLTILETKYSGTQYWKPNILETNIGHPIQSKSVIRMVNKDARYLERAARQTN